MKKIGILVLVLMVMGSSFVFASFSDISSSDHAYKYINWLEEEGVVEGYGDGTFRPENSVSRVEFLKMLYETVGMENSEVTLDFSDVPADEWYTKYVKEAYSNGAVKGYSDKTFRPGNPISFVEALKIVMSAYFDVDDLYGDGEEYEKCGDLGFDTYSGVDIDEWYWKYIHVADELCMFEDIDFDFGEEITRADMAALLYVSNATKDKEDQKFSSGGFDSYTTAPSGL